MPIVKLLSENPEPRWATHAIVFQGKKLLFRSRTEAETAAVAIRKKGIEVQVMVIRERAKNPNSTPRKRLVARSTKTVLSKLLNPGVGIWVIELSKDKKKWIFADTALDENDAAKIAKSYSTKFPNLYVRAKIATV